MIDFHTLADTLFEKLPEYEVVIEKYRYPHIGPTTHQDCDCEHPTRTFIALDLYWPDYKIHFMDMDGGEKKTDQKWVLNGSVLESDDPDEVQERTQKLLTSFANLREILLREHGPEENWMNAFELGHVSVTPYI